MKKRILKLITNNYSLIHKKHGDGVGIPLVSKDVGTIYAVKSCGEVRFVVVGGEYFSDEWDNSSLVLSLGRFINSFEDFDRRMSYYTELKSMLQSNACSFS